MSQPLKLTIHPRLEDTNLSAHDIHQARLTTLRLAQTKRLTEAELAAEYWRADGGSHITAEYSALEGWFNDRGEEYLSWDAADHWRQTVHRFATSPHYFEVDQ